MAEFPPELLRQLAGMPGLSEEDDILQQQLAQTEALRQGSGRQYTTGLGAALGGLGDALKGTVGAFAANAVRDKQRSNNAQRSAARQGFGAFAAEPVPSLDTALLFSDEPTAKEQAAAYVEALRQRRQAGQAALMSGDQVLTKLGQEQLRQAEQGEQMLADAGRFRSGQALQRAMQAQQQNFASGEAEKGRAFDGKQAALKMALERELAGGRMALDAAKAQAAQQKEAMDTGTGLRKELHGLPQTKAFQDVSVAYDKVQRAAKAPSAAGDLSLIFGFMKMLDPGSSVREGEFANAQNAAGVPERILAQYNKMVRGERLTPETRADFLTQAQGLYGAHETQYKQLAKHYSGLASKAGVSPEDVVLGPGAGAPQGGSFDLEQPATPPQAGRPSPKDAAALKWATENPDDPRAARIIQMHGAK